MSKGNDLERLGMILTSEKRRKMVEVLALGDQSFTSLLNALETTPGNLNHHILLLRSAGLLTKRQQRYSLTTDGQKIAAKIAEL